MGLGTRKNNNGLFAKVLTAADPLVSVQTRGDIGKKLCWSSSLSPSAESSVKCARDVKSSRHSHAARSIGILPREGM